VLPPSGWYCSWEVDIYGVVMASNRKAFIRSFVKKKGPQVLMPKGRIHGETNTHTHTHTHTLTAWRSIMEVGLEKCVAL
jgi:hypothetical protein